MDQYRKLKLGIQCGNGKNCRTDENITSYAAMIGDERTIFNNNIKNMSDLDKSKDSLTRYKNYKKKQLEKEDLKNAAIYAKRKREVDNLTGEDTAKIKKHCNYISMNIASIQSSTNSQNNLNANATVWSTQSLDKVNSGGMPDSPNQASITPCTNSYELPTECTEDIYRN